MVDNITDLTSAGRPRSTLTHRLEALAPAGVGRWHPAMSRQDYEAHLQQIRQHLKEQVNAAIAFAGQQGLSPEETTRIVVGVAADGAAAFYGTGYLQTVAQMVVDRAGAPIVSLDCNSEPR